MARKSGRGRQSIEERRRIERPFYDAARYQGTSFEAEVVGYYRNDVTRKYHKSGVASKEVEAKAQRPRTPSTEGDASSVILPPALPADSEILSPASASDVFEVDITMGSTVEPPSAAPPPPPTPVVSMSDPRIGTTLVGRYRIDKLVGKGGMGRVYRATQFPLNRPVAVKILNPEFQRKDPQFVKRFFLEAASAARLTHPNTITVFDYGEAESGELFIAMEYLQGRPLSRVIVSEGPFPAERTLHIAIQICRALREAHAKGIIHRDLKPGNILLLEEGDDRDFVKVLDFGLVKLYTPDGGTPLGRDGEPLTPDPVVEGELTKAGMFLGSPKYMSPEQIQGLSLDQRTDIYALGVLMFQMTSGRPPFTGTSSVEVIYKHVNQEVPWLREVGIGAPLEIEQVIRKCLAKKREERFNSMSELLVHMKDAHRLLTGVSAAETGAAIELSTLRRSSQNVTSGPIPAVNTSKRPQTHASAGEAAFLDSSMAVTDDTGAQSNSRISPPVVPGGPSTLQKIVPMLLGGTLVVVLGVWAFILARPNAGPPAAGPGTDSYAQEAAPEPVAEVKRKPRVTVNLTSEPTGAEVFHNGVSLGMTPLKVPFAANTGGGKAQEFSFSLKGYSDQVKRIAIGESDLSVAVSFGEGSPEATPQNNGNGSVDYKENPY